jgi:hypothetical protein
MKTKYSTRNIVQEITPERNTAGDSFAATATTIVATDLDIGIAAGCKKGGRQKISACGNSPVTEMPNRTNGKRVIFEFFVISGHVYC